MGEERIYQILRNAIFNADLPPGTQLVETSLAEAFGVSRTPIRAVLQRLKYESLVQIVPNRGAFVYCPSPDEAEHIFKVRQLLEPEAARLAAYHATDVQLSKMETLLQQEKELYLQGEPVRALEVIHEFHLTIVEACQNPILIRYLQEILSLSHILFTFYDVSDADHPHSYEEHLAIFEAIRTRDGDRAYDIASQHVPSMKNDIDFSRKLNRSLSMEQIIVRYAD